MITHWVKTKEGKELPIRFSQSVSVQMGTAKGIPMSELAAFIGDMSKWTPEDYIKFYYFAFKAGHHAERMKLEISEEDLMYLLLDDEPELMDQIITVANSSQPDGEKKTAKGQAKK